MLCNCSELERGLRKSALAALDRFLGNIESSPLSDRTSFVSWLLHEAYFHDASHRLAPEPLWRRVIRPTLAEWLEAEPFSSEPHRWLGGHDHWVQALKLDPADQIAQKIGFLDHRSGGIRGA